MRNTIAILAIAAAGVVPLASEPAEAGVSVSFGLNLGRHPRPVVVRRPLPAPIVVSRPVRVPAPVVVRTAVRVPVTILSNNHTISNLSAGAGTGRYFRIHVPAGQTYLTVLTEGGFGESDLYVAREYLPTPGNHQYASTAVGTYEQVSILYPTAGYWYVLVHGAGSYGGVSLLASWWRQEVYYDDPACYLQPSRYANTRVYVYWDHLYPKRPAGGLIPYILRRLRSHHGARHRVVAPRPHRTVRAPVVPYRPPAPVRPRIGGSRPPARTVVPRAAPPRRPAVSSTVRRAEPTRRLSPPATARTSARGSTTSRTAPARPGGTRRPSTTSGRSGGRRR